MPANRVSGGFDLNDRPAVDALGRIKGAGEAADASMDRLGRTIDAVVTPKNVAELDDYQGRLDRLGRTTADPSINLKGSAEGIASIDEYQRKLDQLSRTQATPSVDTRGIDRALAQVELLHQRINALGRQTARPNVNVGSGFGGGGGGGGGLPLGISGKFAALGGLALSAGSPLLGGATALVGSATQATLGAGALAITGGGVLTTSLAAIAPTAILAAKSLKTSDKALAAYDKQVVLHGIHSTQAKTAQAELNRVLSEAPAGTRRLLFEIKGLKSEWEQLSRPGQSSLTHLGAQGVGTARQLAPQFAGIGNNILGNVNQQFTPFSSFLTNQRSTTFYTSMGQEAAADVALLRQTSENVLQTLENIARAGRPFFHEGVEFVEHWTSGWKTGTDNIKHTRAEIGHFVDELKAWGHLGGAGFRLISDLISPSAGPGTSMVHSLTGEFEKWDRWIQRNPAQVKSFFTESVQSVDHIATALGHIATLIFKLSQLATPLLNEASQFITFASGAGLLEPGMLPLLLAGGVGVRNAVGGARTRILGGAGAGTATEGLVAGSVMGGGGMTARGVTSQVGSFFGRVRSAGMMPVAGAGGSLAAEADAGLIGASRFSAVRAAGYGASELGGAALGRAGSFARGFGSRFLPIAALMGGLQFASFPGDFEERAQAAASGLTLGLQAPPMTAAQRAEAAASHAHNIAVHYQTKYGSSSLSGFDRQMAGLRRSRHQLLIPTNEPSLTQEVFGKNPLTGEDTLHVSDENRKAAAALHRELVQLHGTRTAFALERGHELGGQFEGAFDIRKQRGAVAGLTDITGPILHKITELGPAGGRILGQNVLRWAKEAKQHNPKLAEAYEGLLKGIESRFEEMGKNIAIVNGRIYTGSTKEWSEIAKSMAEPIEHAKEEMKEAFTAIEREAMGALLAMGYSPSAAHRVVQGIERGEGKRGSTESAVKAETGFSGKGPSAAEGLTGHKRGATGMRLSGPDLHDNVHLGGNQWGAGGELVVNRHTERRVNMMLNRMGTSLGFEVANEGQPHSKPPLGFARGGRTGTLPGSSGGYVFPFGHTHGLSWGRTDQGVDFTGSGPISAIGAGRVISTGAPGWPEGGGVLYSLSGGPDRGKDVFVYEGVDAVVRAGQRIRAGQTIANFRPGGSIETGWANAAGVPISHGEYFEGKETSGGKQFLSFLHGIQNGRVPRGGGRGGGHINLTAPRSGMGGTPGALVNSASQMMAAGLSQKLNRIVGGGHGGPAPGGLGGSAQQNMALAQHLLSHFGWGSGEFAPLKSLWTQESGWSTTATNPSSGAYGIPQALPASKMGSIAQGSGPAAARAQILWGLKYIKERYGSPAGAEAHEQSAGWYGKGGRLPGFAGWYGRGGAGIVDRPALLGVGDKPEEVQIRPLHHNQPRSGGGQRPIVFNIDMRGATIKGGGDAKKIGKDIGEAAAAHLAEALAATDGVGEKELTG